MVTIKTPPASFVQFGEALNFDHPVFGVIDQCLPVFSEDDVAFQFVLEFTTKMEADEFAAVGNTDVSVGLSDPQGETITTFVDQPERFRISDQQILYNWKAGFPGFGGLIEIGECFLIQVKAGDFSFESSTCFQRIPADDFTSVLEYGNEDNSFGFNYCASGVIDPDQVATCEPTEIVFTNEAQLTIPYTAQMRQAYGNTPVTQVWIYDESGDLVNAGIEAKLDAYPPNNLIFDFGGMASGILVIK